MGKYYQDQSCALLGVFGILIQFFLGFVCFAVLVIKLLCCEHPRRSFKIWILDSLN